MALSYVASRSSLFGASLDFTAFAAAKILVVIVSWPPGVAAPTSVWFGEGAAQTHQLTLYDTHTNAAGGLAVYYLQNPPTSYTNPKVKLNGASATHLSHGILLNATNDLQLGAYAEKTYLHGASDRSTSLTVQTTSGEAPTLLLAETNTFVTSPYSTGNPAITSKTPPSDAWNSHGGGIGAYGGAGGVPNGYLFSYLIGASNNTHTAEIVCSGTTPETYAVMMVEVRAVNTTAPATGSSAGVASTSGTLAGTGTLSGSIGGTTTIAGAVSGGGVSTGIAAGTSVLAGVLTATAALVGAVTNVAAVTGALLNSNTAARSVYSAIAYDMRKLRVTFSQGLTDLTTDATGALRVSNWSLVRILDSGLLLPVATVVPTAVDMVNGQIFDLTIDTDWSPGGSYMVSVKPASQGGVALVADSPLDRFVFAGYTPPSPVGRVWDLWSEIPWFNRNEDETGDLERFIRCLQDPATVMLAAVDRWPDILDYDRGAENFLDLMLQGVGYKLPLALTELDKRRLLSAWIPMVKQKGTVQGIKAAIRFFLGYESDVIWAPRGPNVPGTAYSNPLHGTDMVPMLNLGTAAAPFTFAVKVGKTYADPMVLTTDETEKVSAILDFNKLGQHLYSLSAVLPPPSNVVATPGSGQITISWDPVPGADGYVVFHSAYADVTPGWREATADAASPLVHTVAAGQKRYYVVTAQLAGVNGVASAQVSGTAA